MEKILLRKRRQGRIRSKISGTEERPRLAIFKSNRYLYAQIIDDKKGQTIASSDTRASKLKTAEERIKEAGANLAKSALDKKVKEIVFDRGGFKYTGRIKIFADAVREGGLKF